MQVLGLIPARGGSKGITRKNIRELAGKPLLQWTAEAALTAKSIASVVLSTDDDEIAAVGRQCGLRTPFLRPRELATDDTPTLPVVQHALRTLEQSGEAFDAVCLLQPTNPFRTAADIDACIELFISEAADSVLTILPVPLEYNPRWVYFREADGSLRLSTGESQPIARRQLLPPAFHREGSVYVTRRDVIMQMNSLYGERVIGYEVARHPTINLDTPSDWLRAEALIEAGAL